MNQEEQIKRKGSRGMDQAEQIKRRDQKKQI